MRRPWPRLAAIGALMTVTSGCAGGPARGDPPPEARVVDLPGAANRIDFDDIVYSPRLGRVLLPARESGLYLVDPDTATRIGPPGDIASADEGRGLLFLADRSARTITVINPADGAVVSSVPTAAKPDYIRYIDATSELWVTEPGADSIEIFTLPDGPAPTPRPAGTVPVPDGPEGFVLHPSTGAAYTHAGNDLVAIDLARRAVTARWPTGCKGTHGFPRVDARLNFALTSCADNGAVSLLDLDDGRQLGRYELGAGEALPAHSDHAGNFYVRADPGTTLATLRPSEDGLTLIREVTVPNTGHCLTPVRQADVRHLG